MEIIREMEIYAEALPGPNRAELHHYHHDDVVRTSAAPCRSHVFFHGVWNVMHASRAAGVASSPVGSPQHSHPLKTQPHRLRLNELEHTAEIVCAAQWRHVASSEDASISIRQGTRDQPHLPLNAKAVHGAG